MTNPWATFLLLRYLKSLIYNSVAELRVFLIQRVFINSLQIIYAADTENSIVSLVEVPKFEKGQLVKVTEGGSAVISACTIIFCMILVGVFVLADIMNMKLVRTGTIAEGAKYCDFRYSRQ